LETLACFDETEQRWGNQEKKMNDSGKVLPAGNTTGLIKRIQADQAKPLEAPKDDDAWDKLLAKYKTKIYARLIYKWEIPESEIDDVANGLLAHVSQVIDEHYQRDKGEFWNWLCTVIDNKLSDTKKAQQRKRANDDKYANWFGALTNNSLKKHQLSEETTAAPDIEQYGDPVNNRGKREVTDLLTTALAELKTQVKKPLHYDVFKLCVIREKSQEEIMSEYHITRDQLKGILKRVSPRFDRIIANLEKEGAQEGYTYFSQGTQPSKKKTTTDFF
jgi:RNA polymerase sigma factor (sigma-70 family)